MITLEPIYLVELFPRLDAKLIELLQSLADTDWQQPTTCAQWNVKDIAAHLLDGNLRKLSIFRDNYLGDPPANIDSYQALVDYLNRLNADWVRAVKRLSPRIIIELLKESGEEVYQLLRALDPHAPARFPVAWAGETESENWFDIAREYTERWHHQQQIRLAVDRPGIDQRELYYPVLDTFMRALPYNYRNIAADNGSLLKFQIVGEAGGDWFLLREERGWRLLREATGEPVAAVEIDEALAWRIFTKGIARTDARAQILINGDERLGSEILNMLAVMA